MNHCFKSLCNQTLFSDFNMIHLNWVGVGNFSASFGEMLGRLVCVAVRRSCLSSLMLVTTEQLSLMRIMVAALLCLE